jgi:hypothetical protein
MKRNKLYIISSLALVFAFAIAGCTKFETLPQLEIQVVDESGSKIKGAYVALFNSTVDWAGRSNPVQVWRMTDSDGKVLFVDLQEIEYYVYVRFDGKDNSLDDISTFEPLTVNKRKVMTVHIR